MSASVRQRIVALSSVAGRPAVLLLGLVSAGLALRHVGLEAGIAAAGQRGPLAFVGLAAAACAVGIPRQVVAYSGGLAFGFWPGATLALLAEILGCIGNFYWARWAARAWTARWLARGGGRIERLGRFLSANAFATTLTLRLLPVGSNLLLNLLAGVSGVAAGPFLAASALGYVPQTAVFALLGGGVRVSQGAQVAVAAMLLVLSVALGLALARRRSVP